VNRGEAGISCAVGKALGAESQQCASQPGRALKQHPTLLIARSAKGSLEQLDRSPERKSPLELPSGRAKETLKSRIASALLDMIHDDGKARLRASYGQEKFARLVALKDKYDPENVFSLNPNIPPSVTQT
jgi:hypothetical protein